jgi:hypothetical protein
MAFLRIHGDIEGVLEIFSELLITVGFQARTYSSYDLMKMR